jgi:hypothetical protein
VLGRRGQAGRWPQAHLSKTFVPGEGRPPHGWHSEGTSWSWEVPAERTILPRFLCPGPSSPLRPELGRTSGPRRGGGVRGDGIEAPGASALPATASAPRPLACRLSTAQRPQTRTPPGTTAGHRPPSAARPGEPGETSGPRGGSGETPPRPAGPRLSRPPRLVTRRALLRAGGQRPVPSGCPSRGGPGRGRRVEVRNRDGRAAPVAVLRGADLSHAERRRARRPDPQHPCC